MNSPQPETIQVESIEQFVQITSAWHAKQVNTLRHMTEIPEGSEMQAGDVKVTLTGDILVGFKAGIETALLAMGNLPFGYETEEEPATAG